MTTAMIDLRFRRCTLDHLKRYERHRPDCGAMVEIPDWQRAMNLYGAKLMIESDRMPNEEKALLIRDLASRITGDHAFATRLAAAMLDRIYGQSADGEEAEHAEALAEQTPLHRAMQTHAV